jgi:nucleotide-binding universal stress UspA family protein
VVVGVDGSRGADAALRFSIDESRLRRAELRIVSAWDVPPTAYAAGFAPIGIEEGLEKAAEAVIRDALQRVQRPGEVTIETAVVRGQAAEALLRAAADADLLVVGSRGRGGFRSLLLGSVSHQVASHSHIPVAIVPTPRDTEQD